MTVEVKNWTSLRVPFRARLAQRPVGLYARVEQDNLTFSVHSPAGTENGRGAEFDTNERYFRAR